MLNLVEDQLLLLQQTQDLLSLSVTLYVEHDLVLRLVRQELEQRM